MSGIWKLRLKRTVGLEIVVINTVNPHMVKKCASPGTVHFRSFF